MVLFPRRRLGRRPSAARRGRTLLQIVLLGLVGLPGASAQAPDEAVEVEEAEAASERAPTVVTDVVAGEADSEGPRRKLITWNEIDGPITTFRFSFGVLYEFAHYEQDDASEEQFQLEDEDDFRDARLLFRGTLKTKRPITWSAGLMWNTSERTWHARQTGFMIGVPELNSRVFIGRTKEGYSMVKVMTGYYGWTMERSEGLDAFVPILADGVKWMYYQPERRIHWSLGLYVDSLSNRESFATYDENFAGRLVWQPLLSESESEVLHLGVMARGGNVDEGSLRVRSRPEAYLAPYFLDAGALEADWASAAGYEVYYRKKNWLFGTEYHWQEVDVVTGERPLFHAGDAVVTWNITGETRPYNSTGAYFGMVSPERTVFEGGWGGWEAVLRVTYSDFDAGPGFEGGKFWRVTPMVNWYLTDNLRLEFAYGYGELDRFGVVGATQFFQTRFQFAF